MDTTMKDKVTVAKYLYLHTIIITVLE